MGDRTATRFTGSQAGGPGQLAGRIVASRRPGTARRHKTKEAAEELAEDALKTERGNFLTKRLVSVAFTIQRWSPGGSNTNSRAGNKAEKLEAERRRRR